MTPKPERRLLKAKSMTMCVGFVCRDGVVLAADRQMTLGHTYQDCKVRTIGWKNGRAIWAFSAENIATFSEFWENVEKAITPQSEIKRDEIKDVLKAVLKQTLKDKSKKEAFLILFGAWTQGEQPVLLRSYGVDVTYGDRCEAIGWGDSPLSRYLRSLYLKSGLPNVEQGILSAIYFVKQEKLFNGQFVGGDTDVYFMKSSPSSIYLLPAPQIAERESKMNSIEWWVTSLLQILTDREAEPEAIEERKVQFYSLLESLRRLIE